MARVAIAFLLGLGIGYSYGYHEGALGAPSYMQMAMSKSGVYKIQAEQQRREQATDAATR